MPVIPALTSFSANTLAKSAEVNANFSSIRTTVNTFGLFTDVAASISAAYTFQTAPTFSVGCTVTAGGITVTAGGITVSAGGLTVTGNSTITGTLGGLTGLTVASGGAAITGTTTITGALTASGVVTGASFSGAGTGLTAVPAGELTGALSSDTVNASTIPASRLSAGTAQGAITIPGVTSSAGFSMTGGSAAQTPRTATISASTHTIDCSTGNWFERTVDINTTISFSNFAAGQEIRVLLKQGAAGGFTASFSGVQWSPSTGAPVLTATANKWDTFVFVKRNDGTVMGFIGEQGHS